MGKHVVYIRARDENELRAVGLDPSEWVRKLVKRALEERAFQPKDKPRRKL